MSHFTSQNIMRYVFDFLKLVAAALVGAFLYAAVFQLMVSTGLMAADLDGEGYGHVLTQEVVIVWALCVFAGLIALFIHAGWRWPILFAPAYAPALFAFIRVVGN